MPAPTEWACLRKPDKNAGIAPGRARDAPLPPVATASDQHAQYRPAAARRGAARQNYPGDFSPQDIPVFCR